ncbi:MAG: hypothetical protein ACOC8F_06995 [Planctomycetota bacterium]
MPLLCTALLVFYLYLLVNWSRVQRPWAFCIGAAGLLVIFVAQLFVVGLPRGRALWIVSRVMTDIGAIVASAGAMLAAYKGAFPAQMMPGSQQPQAQQDPTQQPPQPPTQQG